MGEKKISVPGFTGPILDIGEERLLCTSEDKKSLEVYRRRFQEFYPDAKFRIKPFYLFINTYDSQTNLVTDWNKGKRGEGYSLWFSPSDALDKKGKKK